MQQNSEKGDATKRVIQIVSLSIQITIFFQIGARVSSTTTSSTSRL